MILYHRSRWLWRIIFRKYSYIATYFDRTFN